MYSLTRYGIHFACHWMGSCPTAGKSGLLSINKLYVPQRREGRKEIET